MCLKCESGFQPGEGPSRAFSVITNLRMELFEALVLLCSDFECSAAINGVVRRPAPGCWWGSSASGTGARSLATPGSTPG